MRKYTVLAVFGVNPGTVLGLNAEQAARRRHALKPLEVDKKTGSGTFEVLSRVEFKIGEQIATDMELTKHLASQLEPVEDTAAKAREKARAAAAAKDLAEMKEKAARWDEFQERIEDAQRKCAAFDSLPDDVRAAALANTTKK